MRIFIALLLSASINVSVVHGCASSSVSTCHRMDGSSSHPTRTSSTSSQPAASEVARLANAISSEVYVKTFVDRDCFKFILEEEMEPEEKDRTVLEAQAKAFYLKLGKVAENPVGKILLYRLLIELDKPSTEKEKELSRDSLKKLKILKVGRWSYSAQKSQLVFEDGNIYPHDNVPNPTTTSTAPDSEEIYLFHEMLHWFHALQDIEHYDIKVEKENFSKEPALLNFFELGSLQKRALLLTAEVAQQKITNLNPAIKNKEGAINGINMRRQKEDQDIETINPAEFYGNLMDEWGVSRGKLCTLEEILTVLGRPSHPSDVNGSELSENLFRLAGGYGIRIYYIDFNGSRIHYDHSPFMVKAIMSRIIEVAMTTWKNIQ
ncbi:hypothetical protein [Candidatus Paracaedibacter symbiosus]|uniref:hypothetical protein n=1 Tax=Candidatus Paracaedibacter symbiosus TaxID=244582 RepID=UPI0012EB9E51|nr:hypothetical protein [Candidatus Paracaedibacter symbiosus]